MQWRPARYHAVHRLLTNPVYAGVYVFGRTGREFGSKTLVKSSFMGSLVAGRNGKC